MNLNYCLELVTLWRMMMSRFEILTKYINILQPENKGPMILVDDYENIEQQRPIVKYSDELRNFIHDAYVLEENNKDLELGNYRDILIDNGIEWNTEAMKSVDVENLNMQCVLALIFGAIRTDRFFEGALNDFIEGGYVVKWLSRLNIIDQSGG